MTPVKQIILAKKDALAGSIGAPLSQLAASCAPVWDETDALDEVLLTHIETIANCEFLYAWDLDGREISSLIMPGRVDNSWRGRDLSRRPYLKNNLPFKGIMLSSVYHSQFSERECVTALQAVRSDGALMGFIAADFSLDKLVADDNRPGDLQQWQQFKGDPAVRGTLFLQQRIPSRLDENIDSVHETIYDLMTKHGIFHCKIHYSSGRCSFWLIDDPYSYRIHGVEEIVDPDIALAYPLHPYSERAKVSAEQLREALLGFKALRFADETVYLRSASINIMNGMLGLTFSCDGSHYMPVDEFLEKNLGFWIGELAADRQ
ncbi:MAG: PDC sensor domain-containing protein [Candidatus Thiodiazotropha sp. (ex Epidulcina cf. delphinae)]|nr:PDC sensor domain-containing protein [Candidatus Thiodiazotropha sp. (ex Epidulcina cf. delphinae)]